MTIRLLTVHNIMTPYNSSFYEALSQQPGVCTRTIFLAPTDSNRFWKAQQRDLGFDFRILPCLHTYIGKFEAPIYVHWGLWSEMRRFRPDVISICGYHYFATLEVIAFARAHHVPAILWSGSHLRSGFFKRPWVDAYKRAVIAQFDAYLSYGTASKKQLIHYGAPADRIVVGCNTVDVHWFKVQADALRADRLRVTSNTSPTRLLYVGRLVPIKNVGALITTTGHLQRQGLRVSLTIAGDGAQRPSLEALTQREAVHDVTFLRFVTGDSLVEAYVNADVLVLPSLNEPWGLVVNEAAACGTPSVVSTRCGVVDDLIRDGETGLTFDPAIPGDLERALRAIVVDPASRPRMGDAAQHLVLARDHSYYAARLVQAAELAANQPRHSRGPRVRRLEH